MLIYMLWLFTMIQLICHMISIFLDTRKGSGSCKVIALISFFLILTICLTTKFLSYSFKLETVKQRKWLIDWMMFYVAFNSVSVMSQQQLTLFMSFLSLTSTRLGLRVSCRRTLPRKNPEDPVRLEPETPGLRVKHFTTDPRRTP